MDLSKYSKMDLFLSALKSEIDSREVYLKLANGVKNAFLKDKLKFLASEEEKHRILLEEGFRDNFPDTDIIIPERTPVPLPEIRIPEENVLVSEVLESAMEAEKAAYDFYNSFADRFPADSDMKKTLQYLAIMEEGHYKLLEMEKENMMRFESYDQYWPMMHVGP